jgi:chloramphenicol O-acetyltransferase
MNVEIIRSLNIDRFGVWNCDHPQYNNLISISPLYVDVNKNKNINLNYTAVVYRGFNGIMQFAGNSFIRVLPKMDNMLLAIQDDTLYYYSYNDFRSSGISPSTKTFSFFMHSFPQKITSYGDVRAFIKQIE